MPRVVHHLAAFAGDARNLILLSGFQAAGTRGAALAAGAGSIHIHGQEVAVKAQVGQLAASSAHADADELLGWMRNLPVPPRQTFVTHGEPHANPMRATRFAIGLIMSSAGMSWSRSIRKGSTSINSLQKPWRHEGRQITPTGGAHLHHCLEGARRPSCDVENTYSR